MAQRINRGRRGGDTLEVTLSTLAPRARRGGLRGCEHFVQFYESDDFLLDSLGGYVAEGLARGESCVVVAAGSRREGLDGRLRGRGLDPAVARLQSQFITLDAAETLDTFMDGASPEPSRFEESIGGVIARAGRGGRRVRVYGEMVALLWAAGNSEAALRLEALWNGLQQTRAFQLFCSYPMATFGGEPHSGPLGLVCAEHTRVIPTESYTALSGPEERLRAIVDLQRKAAALEAEIAVRSEAESRLRAAKDELEREAVERQRILARERKARAEAEQANRLKDEFLATVSHELRTPLTAIIGWSHMLLHERLDEETARRGLETVERNARMQAQLVEDILDASRVIRGNLRLSIAAVDLAAVVGTAVESVQLAAESKRVRLEVTLDASPFEFTGDASRLQQAVWNLLSNAIKFTPEGGRVGVALRRDGKDVKLEVSDTGCGIEPEFLPYVFDPFRQADGTSTRRHGGLGLGLAITRHLVELHGGSVKADSLGAGEGATFTITLPLADAARPAPLRT